MGIMSGSSPRAEIVGLVLRTLCQGRACGIDLAHLLADQGLELDEGSVYAILRGLEHKGLAIGVWVDAGADLPRRRYYQLTPKGELAASRSDAQLRRVVASAPELLRSGS